MTIEGNISYADGRKEEFRASGLRPYTHKLKLPGATLYVRDNFFDHQVFLDNGFDSRSKAPVPISGDVVIESIGSDGNLHQTTIFHGQGTAMKFLKIGESVRIKTDQVTVFAKRT